MGIRSVKIVRSAPNDRLIDWAPKRVRGRGQWWRYINLPFGFVFVIECGKSVEANECSDYDGIVQVGPEFYDPPDDPWLAGMARGASRAFSDRTLAEPPSHHPIAFRRKGPPDHV
jgi:hypothetical protein